MTSFFTLTNQREPDYMSSITFTAPIAARGQGRPRFSRRTGHVYKDPVDQEYENAIAGFYLSVAKEASSFSGPVALTVKAYYVKPKSWSKRRAARELYKLSKPDLSNIVKAIEDALNESAYADDAQIVQHSAWKGWGERNEIVVEIERLEECN